MGKHTVYYMCKYTPLELFAGFGVDCVRLEPDTDSFAVAESLGHPNLCGYGKGLLETVARQEVRELVLVNCCDVVRRVYDILNARGGIDFLYLLDLPHGSTPADIARMETQLHALAEAYSEYSGIEVPDLESSERERPDAVSCLAAGDNTQERITSSEVAGEQGPYISLLGAHSGAFLKDIAQAHLPLPVRDDTCVGNRRLRWPLPTPACGTSAKNTWHDYAQALLTQTPCMRMTDVSTRRELGKDATGILYHTMKFCDYYGFEYAQLTRETNVPLVKIETDGTRQSEGQLATRLDAFAETLAVPGKERQSMQEGTYTVGIDSGSASTDAVVLNDKGELVGWAVVPTGAGAAGGAQKAMEAALQMANIAREDVGQIVTTGYGRDTVGMGENSVTEITCHARGAHFLDPTVRTVIDIGGQDSKIIRIDEDGAVKNFVMNDKCAAGTGRFLEMMARTMELSLEEMSERGLSWKKDVAISSMCTVFAESEVVSLIARNEDVADIIHGLNESIASRVLALLKRLGEEGAYMMTGGVAHNRGVVRVLEKHLGQPILVSEHAQLCGAIGAALLARKNA